MIRTFEVAHEGTHYPTDAQNAAVLRSVLKDEGLKLAGDVEYHLVENTSGGPSKVRATFETEEVKAPKAEAKTDSSVQRTKTIGG